MYVISIDPGKQGAAVLIHKKQVKGVFPFTGLSKGIDVAEWDSRIKSWKKSYGVKKAVIERITPIPGQNVRSTAEQFFTIGQTEGVLLANNIEYQEVYPQTWQAFARRLVSMDPNTSGKKVAQEVAKTYFEKTANRFMPRTKVHDGVADALALATYYCADEFAEYLEEDDLGKL